MFGCCLPDRFFDFDQFVMRCREGDLGFCYGGADVAGNVQVEVVLFDFGHFYAAGIALYRCFGDPDFPTFLIGFEFSSSAIVVDRFFCLIGVE